jgi:hypothetical protein
MLGFLEKRWDISIGNRDEKARYLNLEFISI